MKSCTIRSKRGIRGKGGEREETMGKGRKGRAGREEIERGRGERQERRKEGG